MTSILIPVGAAIVGAGLTWGFRGWIERKKAAANTALQNAATAAVKKL